MMVGLVVMSVASGQILIRTGRYKKLLVSGTVLMAVALGLLSTMEVDTPTGAVFAYMGWLGVGIGCVTPVLLVATQNAVDREDVGSSTSVIQVFRSIGGSVGVALFGSLPRRARSSSACS